MKHLRKYLLITSILLTPTTPLVITPAADQPAVHAALSNGELRKLKDDGLIDDHGIRILSINDPALKTFSAFSNSRIHNVTNLLHEGKVSFKDARREIEKDVQWTQELVLQKQTIAELKKSASSKVKEAALTYESMRNKVGNTIFDGKADIVEPEKKLHESFRNAVTASGQVLLFLDVNPVDARKEWRPLAPREAPWRACTEPYTIVGWGINRVHVSKATFKDDEAEVITRQVETTHKVILHPLSSSPTPEGKGHSPTPPDSKESHGKSETFPEPKTPLDLKQLRPGFWNPSGKE